MSKKEDEIPKNLHHYTSEEGRNAIKKTKTIKASKKENNPKDARFGDGQYLTDIPPHTKTNGQLSLDFYGIPFVGQKCSNYVTINVEGLEVKKGRKNVFLVPNDEDLDIADRLVDDGVNEK